MILEQIAEKRKIRVEEKKKKVSFQEIRRRAEGMKKDESYPFLQALKKPGMSFICEVKKASPSKGIIAEDFPYLKIAREYEESGAEAVSCLTEPDFFLGRDEYLEEIAQQISIPVLRKDFTVDSYQIYEAKALGACGILLICSLLEQEQLKEYLEITRSLGMSALVEAHDAKEVQRAALAGAQILGVNNRNLKDFTVDVENSLKLRKEAPEDMIFVAESGIRTRQDIERLEKAEVQAVLIGETLMRSSDRKGLLQSLREGERQ